MKLETTYRELRLPSAVLSPREVEVVRLAAQGLSNRKIAEKLVISERTVACHLASIFNKTGADNRAAAVAFAIRHNLIE
ncbi:MAG: response regulator transcription factor [Ktedonobacteraceae bacterium]|nr:response regulator transcription factor [Ktedonobacteraceae bacterium]